MGTCALCSQNAGLFRNEHAECRDKYNAAYARLTSLTRAAFDAGTTPGDVATQADDIARAGLVPPMDRRAALVAGWEQSVESAFSDQLLTEVEEHRLVTFGSSLGLSQSELDQKGAYSRLTKGAVLRDLQEGKLPARMNIAGDLPFNLQKGESLVWAFPSTSLYEVRAHRSFEGGSQGVSVRIARGVYYRVGAFKGHPVERISTDLADVGTLGVTDRSLYFAGAKKGLRVPYRKITSFTPYTDGLGIQRDAVSARPQAFVVADKDGWFIFNLVSNLAQLDSTTPPKAQARRSSKPAQSDQGESDSKKCPDCAETVRADARICRFCRHVFPDDPLAGIAAPPA